MTALSQRYNLYFVAHRDAIAVYRPRFPFQRLRRLPSLVIPLKLANPSAQGYIDPLSPHSINHIIVDDLGTEEIVLVSTDSGNLTAYFTKAVDEAIRKDPYRFSTDARSDYVGVRAIFTHWVYESAWGLSIHSKARMIAVSANTPNHVPSDDPCSKITIFAFALTEQHESEDGVPQTDHDENSRLDDSDHGQQQDWEEWICSGPNSGLPLRNRNYKITLGGLEGHNDNIPSISFVNNDDDPDGRWLLSTDIRGEMKMWEVWRGLCVETWVLAEKRMRGGFQSRREGGWIVAALDSRAFRSAWTMEQFCGHTKAPQYSLHAGESYNLTNIVRLRTPGISLAHPHTEGFPSTFAPVEEEEIQEQTYDGWSDLDGSDDEQGISDFDRSTQNESAEQSPVPLTVPISPRTTGEMEATESRIDNSLDAEVDMSNEEGSEESSEEDVDPRMMLLFDHEHSDVDVEDDEMQYDSSSEDEEEQSNSSSHRSTTSFSSLAHLHSEEPEQQLLGDPSTEFSFLPGDRQPEAGTIQGDKTTERQLFGGTAYKDIPQIPTLHCTASHLRLLMTPQASSAHVFCANILKQALPEYIEMTNHVHLDRINMVQQIPELGIVIVATQIGRCAICTTTRNENTGTLGLRVDWVLPTSKQEARQLRPPMPLLGIAVSPIQGRFPAEKNKSKCDVETTVEWGKDAVVDGVTTTFDDRSAVVVEDWLEDVTNPTTSERHCPHGQKAKCPARSGPSPSNHTPGKAAWTKPESIEPWTSTENSRRYRLMLTYLDMSVLTYEISRGVEREDVIQRETSSLEDLD